MMTRGPSSATNTLINRTVFEDMSQVITVNTEGVCYRGVGEEMTRDIRKFF